MGGIGRTHGHGGPDAVATVAKRAVDAPARRDLAREAAVLGGLAHPGVVRLVAHTEAESHAQLLTERVPGHTLAELALPGTGAVAAVGAAAAAVVADLHALGVSHGSLAPEHLIVSDGRVVLCSFGRAAAATPAAVDRDVADLVVAITTTTRRLEEPTTRVERRHRRRLEDLLVGAASRSLSAADLAAAFATLAAEAGEAGVVSSAAPGTTEVHGAPALHTEQVAPSGSEERTTVEPAPLRPAPQTTARPWRDRVLRHERPRDDQGTDRRRTSRRGVVIGALAGLVVVVTWAALPRDRSATSDATAPPTPVVTPQATATPSPTPRPTTVTSPERDVAGIVVAGNFVGVDAAWFEVGEPGDIVRIGDWDCDGVASPALLRPRTGEVFVFDAWAAEGETLRVAAVTVRPDAADISTRRETNCDTLLVVDRSGNEAPVGAAS